jgi:drug/metabolite transporter (DMT)-like permease
VTSPPAAPAARPGRGVGIAFIVTSALAFGAMAIFARVAYADGVDTWTLLALRFAIAAACLALLARLRGVALPRGRDLGVAALMGAAGYAGQAATFFSALKLAPAGLVALLLYLHPALVAVLAALFLHERVTRATIVAIALALAGLALTVAPALGGSAEAFPQLPAGIALGIAAAVIYAVYIVVGARVTARVAPLALSAVIAAGAAAVFAGVAALVGPRGPATAVGWAAIVAIALVSTVLAISLFFAGLARIGATQASTLSTVEPVFTIALAAIVLDERIAPVQLAGGALILAAVLLLARRRIN